MQLKEASSDDIRVSVSSTHSTSSQGSAFDDHECGSFGNVFVWGEVICGCSATDADKSSPFGAKADVLSPKLLVSNIILDVNLVACGIHHASLVTKDGEVFTWGEEAGGRLGHGFGIDASKPRLVESLANISIGFTACGEFHTCAISTAGELYTWGDDAYYAGFLGHGTKVNQCTPKKVSGPLQGLQVVSISCGIWHTALITSTGQLFTFGDGSFGVLGHGNRDGVAYPREVEALSGLKTVAVACGVWHTAALVELITTKLTVNVSSGKLFTWGDGDKYCLGHKGNGPHLKPTCISSLSDYNFCKVACGHTLTIGLTTTGCVFTMGSAIHGQLGKPDYDGKLPILVEGKLAGEFVEEVACGSYHVAVLTAKKILYTWGNGSNGRLGHGDTDDRKTPTLVETLKDRFVKHVSCGSKFTAAICHHRWGSGIEQAQCSSCRHAFGRTRKRHQCYHCGLVYCHSCSSKKAIRAALSSDHTKPHRVCDPCYTILNEVDDCSSFNRKMVLLPLPKESKDKAEKLGMKLTTKGTSKSKNLDSYEGQDTKTIKQGKTNELLSLTGGRQVVSLLHLKDMITDNALNLQHVGIKSSYHFATSSLRNSKIISDRPRYMSMCNASLAPMNLGDLFSIDSAHNFQEQNEILSQEVERLSVEIENLKQSCEAQEDELQKLESQAQEAIAHASEEFAKSKIIKNMMNSLIAQLKLMAEKLPIGIYGGDEAMPRSSSDGGDKPPNQQGDMPLMVTHTISRDDVQHQIQEHIRTIQPHKPVLHAKDEAIKQSHLNCIGAVFMPQVQANCAFATESGESENSENGLKSITCTSQGDHHVEGERMELYEPGVYITLVSFQDGTKDLKRVRFSRRRFGEQEAACWWSENREKVYEKYNIRLSDKGLATTT